jgi:hypothetical protein
MMPEPDPASTVVGMHLWGWVQPSELEWLADHASRMRSVVEIGSFKGRSSFAIASACPGTVYCIDPWEDATPEYDGTDAWTYWQANVGSQFTNVVPIRGRSPGAGSAVPDPVDMVWIDGSHDYENVVADIRYWNTRAQVLLCGHDYLTFPGVQQAVDELFGNTAYVPSGTWIWAHDKARSEN